MKERLTALDLTFGADVVQLDAPRSPIAQDLDGNAYDFRPTPTSNTCIPSLLAKAFVLGQSKNDRPVSRRRSNLLSSTLLRQFANFCDERSETHLSASLLADYRNEVFGRNAASTAQSAYGKAASTARMLMAHGAITRFQLPDNASSAQVAASLSSSGASFATALNAPTHADGIDTFNEETLAAWIKAAWTELDAMFSRIQIAKGWREEVVAGWRPPDWFASYRELPSLTRADALSLCKSICEKHLGGVVPVNVTRPRESEPPSWTRSLKAIASQYGVWHGMGVTVAQIKAALRDPDVPLLEIPVWAEDFEWSIGGHRSDWMKLIVQLLHLEYGGFPLGRPSALRSVMDSDSHAGRALGMLIERARERDCRITTPEVVSHFHPSAATAGLGVSLLCAAHVNPMSATQLKLASLVDDEQPGVKRLRWDKPRGGGEQLAMPFPQGGINAKTIPRMWEKIVLASSELRSQAPIHLRGELFLWANGEGNERRVKSFADKAWTNDVWVFTRRYLGGYFSPMQPASETTETLSPLLAHLESISLALIRNTAINIASARLGRDFNSTAAMDGRRDVGVLESAYLNNIQTRDHLDRQVREGQASLVAWLSAPPIVLPPDAEAVATTLSIERDAARAVVDDDLNLGMGASMIDDKVIFIDTPLNALRVIQWIAHLDAARDRLLRDSPGRWRRQYEPQRTLFAQALQLLSRRNRAEAAAMDRDIQLPFPELH